MSAPYNASISCFGAVGVFFNREILIGELPSFATRRHIQTDSVIRNIFSSENNVLEKIQTEREGFFLLFSFLFFSFLDLQSFY